MEEFYLTQAAFQENVGRQVSLVIVILILCCESSRVNWLSNMTSN